MNTQLETAHAEGMGARAAIFGAILIATLVVAGCGVSVVNDDKGKTKKVDVEVPFAGIHVKTGADAKDTGIPIYPGARQKPDTKDDQHSANVNIDSPFAALKVVAVSFESDDPPAKILDFYRDKLKTYGNVLECKGEHHGNVHAKPGESRELTCDEKPSGVNVSIDALDSQSTELKVGTTDRAHMVEVKPRGDGSEFALIYLQTRGGKGDSI